VEPVKLTEIIDELLEEWTYSDWAFTEGEYQSELNREGDL
jgi:hypothetical protein